VHGYIERAGESLRGAYSRKEEETASQKQGTHFRSHVPHPNRERFPANVKLSPQYLSATFLSLLLVERISISLLKNLEFVIPNGVCEVRNLSFLGIVIEEGFLASLGMRRNAFISNP